MAEVCHVAEVAQLIVVEGEGVEVRRDELFATSEAADLILVEQQNLKKRKVGAPRDQF
jgi:hypothetical protein